MAAPQGTGCSSRDLMVAGAAYFVAFAFSAAQRFLAAALIFALV
jgi:hypothetical protein